ncbi:MAG: exopolyphosphatase [Acidobacteria bacterium]|nr:exopolyphosphatase [Acidobacteriota bacterium]
MGATVELQALEIRTIESAGLDFWMTSVIRECDRVQNELAPDPIHDLRVALRRCRSMADGYMAFDPHPAWKQMKDEGRRLFQQLGALRDTQVMLAWNEKLASSADAASFALNRHLTYEEGRLKEGASEAIRRFNRKKWLAWTKLLGKHALRVPAGSLAFHHLALERWSEVHHLHRQALRNRSHIGYHRLRIGLKKFRYTIENFLPDLHSLWGPELKELQDLLGEVHDLDVLWRTAVLIKAFPGDTARLEWRRRIEDERFWRLQSYHARMTGKASLLSAWRSGLPAADRIQPALLARIGSWAAYRDPDSASSMHVAGLALQLYDGLDSLGLIPEGVLPNARFMLNAAAVAQKVGISRARKKHQIHSYRIIRRLKPQTGCDTECLRYMALVARFHRGSLPRPGQKAFAGMSGDVKSLVFMLCGILRLANSFGVPRQRRINRLELKRQGDVLIVTAPGYSANDKMAERLAAARHLLESCLRLPILIG